jgi:hypothetical protein
MTVIDIGTLTPVKDMSGEDAEDTDLLRASLEEARIFLSSFGWCHAIKEIYFGLGVGGIVSVFLFHIDRIPPADEWIWVVTGDMPSSYLVTDAAHTPVAALERYCDLMEDWATAVRGGRSLTGLFPVAAHATQENADSLSKRIEFLRKEIIPAYNV